MDELELKATIREVEGKSGANRLRREGYVPCILYGVETHTVSLAVNKKELEKLMAETRSVFIIDYADKKQRSVIKEIQYHPVKGDIIHLDLLRVKAGQEINVSVPLSFIGTAPGVKIGGVFQELKFELDVTCLPKHLPNQIEVDISELSIGDAIHLSDIEVEHISFKADPTTTLCSVAAPKKVEEVVVEAEEEEIEEEAEEPEVITAKSKDEQDREGKKED
jgi:large subunit ribosomal protein L25